ncbi:hypothetical protein ACU1JV_06055 [Paenibacillus sp. T2-29]|uniref:hypothetical protein n=1 Tax=Paenibacillus TaxID=44249 RepID=UPI0039BCD5CD
MSGISWELEVLGVSWLDTGKATLFLCGSPINATEATEEVHIPLKEYRIFETRN